jgi:hypothetical protein
MQERNDDTDRQRTTAQYAMPAYAPPPPRRRGGRILTAAAVVGALAVGIAVGDVIGRSQTTNASIATSPLPDAASTSGAHPASTTAAAKKTPAKVGDSIALTGIRANEKLTVTLVKFADPATVTDQFMQADAGKRYVAVQIRITNTASTVYSDSPTNGAEIIDAKGQQYDLTFVDTSLGQNFAGSVKLQPGATALGVMEFEMPTGEKPVTFQFTLNSGFADQTGQWQLG